jgi:hypothetical protein
MIELNSSQIIAIYAGLFVFGVIYNLLIAHFEKRGWLEGFTWMVVSAGVGVTVIALVTVSWQFTLIALGAFFFSGLPMIIGAVGRYVARRERSQRSMISEVLDE